LRVIFRFSLFFIRINFFYIYLPKKILYLKKIQINAISFETIFTIIVFFIHKVALIFYFISINIDLRCFKSIFERFEIKNPNEHVSLAKKNYVLTPSIEFMWKCLLQLVKILEQKVKNVSTEYRIKSRPLLKLQPCSQHCIASHRLFPRVFHI